MALQLAAAHSRKSAAAAAAVPLLMFGLLAAAPATSAASSHQPSDVKDYGTCFFAYSCGDTGCAIRCRDLGWNPAGSGCKTFPGIGQCCCCARPNSPSPSSSPAVPSFA